MRAVEGMAILYVCSMAMCFLVTRRLEGMPVPVVLEVQHHAPGAVVPTDLSKQISPETIDRLNQVLNNAASRPGVDGSGGARLTTRGPYSGQRAGDYETPTRTPPTPWAWHSSSTTPTFLKALRCYGQS